MRFSFAPAVLLAVWSIFSPLSGRAHAEGPAGVAAIQPKDWINLDRAAVVAAPVADTGSTWSPSDQEPVLLPLPAEWWAGMILLGTVVTYCGIRRARFLAIR